MRLAVRCLSGAIVGIAVVLPMAAWADDVPPSAPALAPDAAPVVQEFSGSGTTTTGFFKVTDHWEVRWNARQVVSVAVMSKDGTIVAGGAGVLRGSLFVPLGGEYYLKITDGTSPPPASPPAPAPDVASSTNAPPATNAPVANVPPTPAPAVTNVVVAESTSATNAPAAPVTNAAPDSAPADAAALGEESPAAAPISWHLQVVQLAPAVSASQALTVYAPYFEPPDTAVTPDPPAPPPPVLTTEQAQTVVKIKGDAREGAGFLVRTTDGTFVLTHLHLLEANPNCKVLTQAGDEIPTLGCKGATDRDLALFTIADNHYSYLPFDPTAADKLDSGDPLIIPDIAGPADPMLGKAGRVMGVTAERIDFDNPVTVNCAGAPVILAKSGAAVGIVTAVKLVDVSRGLAQAWRGNPPPGSAGLVPCYGLRTGGASAWEVYDPQRFLDESLFLLDQFHRTTRCLDSFLNGRRHRRAGENAETGPPDIRYFLNDPKVKGAFDMYKHFAGDADWNQRMEGARELIFDLQAWPPRTWTSCAG